MEASKNYVDFYDLVSSITRIANNMDKLLEIMTTTSIKMNPDKAKAVLNEWYGTMVMDEVRKKFWTANEIGKKDDEIQDLKLENDRLKQRDAIMLAFIKSIDCTDRSCVRCVIQGENGTCKWTLFPYRVEMVNDVLKKLEEL